MHGVVTQFWTPRAGDGVYIFWTECRSLAHIRQKIDKSTKINMLFFNLVWAVFCSFFILPLCCQNRQVFLDWSEVFIMPNSFLFYLVFKVEKKSLRICVKKMVLLLSQFLFQLRLWFWLGFVRYLTILGIFCHSWYVKKLTYTFIRS